MYNRPVTIGLSQPTTRTNMASKKKLTCCDRGRSCINDGGVEVCLAEGRCHTSSDAQHFPEGVLIAMSHL